MCVSYALVVGTWVWLTDIASSLLPSLPLAVLAFRSAPILFIIVHDHADYASPVLSGRVGGGGLSL